MATDAIMEHAYQWLCNQRKDRSHNNSVWDLRFHWKRLKPELQHQLLTGTYQLNPLRSFQINNEMSKHGFYVRFMDDWVIMVKTKRQLRRIIKLTHQILNQLKLKMHPDKTYLGWIKKGFDFLGVHFDDIPTISKTSLDNHRTKIAQRYAQGASDACIGNYMARWTLWCASVLKRCSSNNHNINSMELETNRNLGLMGLLKEQNNGYQGCNKENSIGKHNNNYRAMLGGSLTDRRTCLY